MRRLGGRIVIIAVLLLLPLGLGNQYRVHMLNMICVYTILAVGLNLVMGFTGQINIGHYGFYAIGAYTSALLAVRFGLNFWLVMPIAVLVTGLFGFIVGYPILKLEGAYLALATLGLAESVRIILNNSGWSGQSMGVPGIPNPTLGSFVIDSPLRTYYFYLPFVLLTVIVSFNVINSTMGRRFRAVRDDPLAANVIGVNVRLVRVSAFVISALYAGLAGSLYAHYAGYISPTIFIQNLQITFLLMVVLGGLGHGLLLV